MEFSRLAEQRRKSARYSIFIVIHNFQAIPVRVPSFAEACYRAKLILARANNSLCSIVSSEASRNAAAARNLASFYSKINKSKKGERVDQSKHRQQGLLTQGLKQ